MKCVQCFSEIGSEPKCPRCGADQTADREKRKACRALPTGCVLHCDGGNYELGRVLGAGGFGITYLAKDAEKNRLLAVKEFFPSQICERNEQGMVCPKNSKDAFKRSVNHFCREAEILHKLDRCPNVANVDGVFLANNTAYLVMEFIRGPSLSDVLKKGGGRMPYPKAREILLQIANALRQVHEAGLVHSDISPSNILLEDGKRVKLIDFGAARSVAQEQDGKLTVQVKPGFSPPEQYAGSHLPMGPWTDLYAMAGTFMRMLTGVAPPTPVERKAGEKLINLRSLLPEMPEAEEQAIMKALELDYLLRPKSVDEFIREFSGAKTQKEPTTEIEPNKAGILGGLFGARNNAPLPSVELYMGGRRVKRINLKPGRVYLAGREKSQCDLKLPEEATISRVHLSLCFIQDKNMILLEDRSTNGTVLEDGSLLRRSRIFLAGGCSLYLASGNVILRIIFNNKQEDRR